MANYLLGGICSGDCSQGDYNDNNSDIEKKKNNNNRVR